MTVYVVMENHFDVARINGIFASEALAEKQIEQLKSKKNILNIMIGGLKNTKYLENK